MNNKCDHGFTVCEHGICPNECKHLMCSPHGTLPANTPEPAPISQPDEPAVWDLVIADMRARDQFGFDKYKTRLKAHNGRNALVDAYQEALDLCVYLRQKIKEETGK